MDPLYQKKPVKGCVPTCQPASEEVSALQYQTNSLYTVHSHYLFFFFAFSILVKRCHSTDSDRDCSIADSYCNRHVVSLFDQAKRSYYDVRSVRSPPTGYINFLDSNTTKEQIGAVGTYHECSDQVVSDFSVMFCG